jgi:hypothetical protein
MNTIYDKNISLEEPGHKYILSTNPSIQFRSITEIVSNYFEPFNKYIIAEKLVTTNIKYMDRSAEELIGEWDAARDHGTKVHKEIELYLQNDKDPSEEKAKKGIDWLKKYQMKSDIEFYSEIIIYSKELKIAGSIDIIAYDKNIDAYEIIDWKTSKNIEMLSFGRKMGIKPITKNLMDCNFVHYSLQLSLYRYFLEEFYGLKINNQLIAHLNEEKCTAYVGHYLKKEVKDILMDQKNKKDKK